MRRLIIALVLLCVLIAGCIGSYIGVEAVTTEVAQRVQHAEQLAQDADHADAQRALDAAYDLWRQRQPFLGAIVRHNELDDIENLFQRAMQSLADAEQNEYRLQTRELLHMLRHIPEMERPNVQNIF